MPSGLEVYLRKVIDAEALAPGLVPSLLRGVLAGLSRSYDLGLSAYLLAERLGLRKRGHLPIPIVSVGNLSVGGTGKTPMTQLLCRRLQAEGRRVAVLSRGHGGEGTSVRVVSDANGDVLLDASEAGDEPVLLARTLPGVPVLVGKDRRLSGREALRRFALDVLILDDGFQYWQLARDLDIVLLDARLPFDNGFPLPRGLLREPMRHLRRAGVIVVTRADCLEHEGRVSLRARLAALAPEADVYFARHQATGLVPVHDLSAMPRPLEMLSGKRVFALSGIAQPQSFARTLTTATGAQIARHFVYDDHAVYGPAIVKSVQQAARETGADALVMTEKDAVKWPLSGQTGDIPAHALRIEMAVEDEAQFLAAVQNLLSRLA